MNYIIKSISLKMLLFAFAFNSISCSESNSIVKKPNIILIMSDDMGYSDIGCYGGEIKTPNLDKLASNGLRFTQFYNTSRCCPTRASLLTGLYPHQANIGHMTDAGHKLSPSHCFGIGKPVSSHNVG